MRLVLFCVVVCLYVWFCKMMCSCGLLVIYSVLLYCLVLYVFVRLFLFCFAFVFVFCVALVCDAVFLCV